MKQEDKDLLLRDLCARLPYHPKVRVKVEDVEYDEWWTLVTIQDFGKIQYTCIPYLRPMSSMKEEEFDEYESIKGWKKEYELIDWFNTHHFDYRGLIEKGLALEAPEGMYNLKEK